MQIQVNTDNNIEGRDELARRVEAGIEAALSRFSDQITRVEVHLGDESAGQGPAVLISGACWRPGRAGGRR